MNLEAEISDIKKTLKIIASQNRPKQNWVSAKWILKLTGWNSKELASAREQEIVECRDNERGGYEYLLQSVPEEFRIKKEATN